MFKNCTLLAMLNPSANTGKVQLRFGKGSLSLYVCCDVAFCAAPRVARLDAEYNHKLTEALNKKRLPLLGPFVATSGMAETMARVW